MSSAARIFGHGRFVGVEGTPGAKKKAAAAAAVQAASPARRRMIALIHVAKKDLGLADDDYRAILLDVAATDSAAKCSDGELARVIERFKARGWKLAQPTGPGKPRPADHRPAAKARALWISLHALGAIGDPSEKALEAFARRQLHSPRLQWADQGQMFKLIEALKAMAERHGWDQHLEGVKPEARVIVLKRRLIEAIMGKLWAAGIIPVDWDVRRAVHAFAGMETELLLATGSELDIVARELGRVLRETKGAA